MVHFDTTSRRGRARRLFPLREPALEKVGVHAGHAAAAGAGFRAADAGPRDGRVAEVCSRIEVLNSIEIQF